MIARLRLWLARWLLPRTYIIVNYPVLREAKDTAQAMIAELHGGGHHRLRHKLRDRLEIAYQRIVDIDINGREGDNAKS